LTIKAAIAFFVLSFALYLGNVYQRSHANGGIEALPNIAAPAVPVAPVTAAQPAAPVAIKLAPAATGTTTTAPVKP
jgi:preprotein translocase subunit SecG